MAVHQQFIRGTGRLKDWQKHHTTTLDHVKGHGKQSSYSLMLCPQSQPLCQDANLLQVLGQDFHLG